MNENNTNSQQEQQEENIPPFRGLYRHVNISVKALDRIIILCIAVILIVVALELRNPGFTITFDSKGGTDVASQTQMYGELLEVPEDPTREGWYFDSACDILWVEDTHTVDSDVTLYAGWEKIE